MKKVLIPILLLFSIASFALPQKKKIKKATQKETITKIAFETFTRRGNIQVGITKDSAISIGRTEKKFILVSADKWNKILSSLKAVELASVPKWKSPTKQREYDGASHCRITVSTKKKIYESQYFDGGKPMKQLQALYDAIDAIRNDIDAEGKKY